MIKVYQALHRGGATCVTADLTCPFCIGVNAKKGTLSQHFVTHVVPPLGSPVKDRLAQGHVQLVIHPLPPSLPPSLLTVEITTSNPEKSAEANNPLIKWLGGLCAMLAILAILQVGVILAWVWSCHRKKSQDR